MENFDKVKEIFSKVFDLPQDVVLNLPRISVIGNLEILIENHRGIIKYEDNYIKVRVHRGYLIIKGEDLFIQQVEQRLMIITGHITDLSFDLA